MEFALRFGSVFGVDYMIKYVSAIIAATLVAGAAHAKVNLVTNGSFESGLSGFTLVGTEGDGHPPVAITYGAAAAYPVGAFGEAVPVDNAVSLSPDAAGSHGAYFVSDFSHQALQQSIFLKAGHYQIGFDYYAPRNGFNNANDATFTGTIAGVTLVSAKVSAGPVTTWTNYSGEVNLATDGFRDVTFRFDTSAAPAKDVVIDRVYVASVPEPAAWGLMLAGFALVGMAQRRRTTVVSA